MSSHIGLVFLLFIGVSLSDGDSNGTLSEWLWEATLNTRMEALNTSLVTGVKDGSLDPVAFGVYYLQDVLYMFDSADAFDIAAMRTYDAFLKNFLKQKAISSRSYGEGLFEQLPIRDPFSIQLGPQFGGYANHLLTVSLEEAAIYSVLAIIPCRRLWPWIGAKINGTSHNYGPYTKWVGENFDPSYDGYKKYEAIVDEGFNRGLINKNTALRIYSTSMNYEVACFNLVDMRV